MCSYRPPSATGAFSSASARASRFIATSGAIGRIPIGVYHDNVVANNYLDGPFDQMPDNFIEGDKFQQAILAVAPNCKGQINRFGSFADDARFAVVPYMTYRSPKDLAIFDRCATSRRIPAEQYAACLALPLEGSHGANARPLAMQHYAR